MEGDAASVPNSAGAPVSPTRAHAELFLISVLILFLELACIRWFPAHVVFLTFFTNVVLLASFLGMSIGCLLARHRSNLIQSTPAILVIAVLIARVALIYSPGLLKVVDVGNQSSPEFVYFGTECQGPDLAEFFIPIEVIGGAFFVLITGIFIGPGQELGRAFNRVPHRIRAYTLNIAGSIAGILLFAACSWAWLPPAWWFLPAAVVLGYYVYRSTLRRTAVLQWALLAVGLGVVVVRPGMLAGGGGPELIWSPYYRVDYYPNDKFLYVNLLGHQAMVSREHPSSAYALPYLLNRDAGRVPFKDVMIIGAGSGNDVSRALQWTTGRVDAVEIDPVIHRLGVNHHPDRPYQDGRVTVHLDDGRNFLRATDQQYDLVVYALVDSLVLHSSYSNIRLESYLFTDRAFADIRQRLRPGGVFVMYNFFRQGWIVARIKQSLTEVFGTEPLVMTLPYRSHVDPDAGLSNDFTMFVVGDTAQLEKQFRTHGEYWLSGKKAPGVDAPDGFTQPDAAARAGWQLLPEAEKKEQAWQRYGLAQVGQSTKPIRIATDDWPFLYLREPMLPNLSMRGVAVMGGLAFVLLAFALTQLPRAAGARRWVLDGRMFFLGAGFMLLETRAVVHMALLFGSTWMVNSIVFLAVLIMILLANAGVLAFRPRRLWPYFVGLFVALALNWLIPLDTFLGMNRTMQIAGSSLLVFAPILFAGVIFAVCFGRSTEPDLAFGANIAGAMIGGLAESVSMLLGFQGLVFVAIGFYALATLWRSSPPAVSPSTN